MSNRIVSDAAVEEALNQLALLDDKEAELKAAKDYGDAKAKEIFSTHYLKAVGTVAERDAIARTNPDYIKHVENMRIVTRQHQEAKNKRDRLTMVKEVWQSENANHRQRT